MPERRRLSRRAWIRRMVGAVGAASVGGCSRLGGGEGEGTATARDSRCSDGSTPAPPVFDDWLLRWRPEEFTAPTLAVTTLNPQTLREFPDLVSVAAPFLQSTQQFLDTVRLPFRELERTTLVTAPRASRPAYLVCRTPGSPADRRAWVGRLRVRTYVSEEQDYRSFSRHSVRWPTINLIAYDDDHLVATPKATDSVPLEAPTRGERLIDTHLGDEHPYHCYHPDAMALFERLPATDLVAARVRTGDDTFGDADFRAPTGARASGFTFRLHWANRDLVVGTDTPSSGVTATESTGTTGPTATGTPADDADGVPTGDLGMVVVFPEGEGSVERVRSHVEDHRNAAEDTAGLRFEDPTIERSGRVVTVSETRPVDAMTE